MVADGKRHANHKVEDVNGHKKWDAGNSFGWVFASRMAERDEEEFSKNFCKTVSDIGSFCITGGQQNDAH